MRSSPPSGGYSDSEDPDCRLLGSGVPGFRGSGASRCPLTADHLECGGRGPRRARSVYRRDTRGRRRRFGSEAVAGPSSDWGGSEVQRFRGSAVPRFSGSVVPRSRDLARVQRALPSSSQSGVDAAFGCPASHRLPPADSRPPDHSAAILPLCRRTPNGPPPAVSSQQAAASQQAAGQQPPSKPKTRNPKPPRSLASRRGPR